MIEPEKVQENQIIRNDRNDVVIDAQGNQFAVVRQHLRRIGEHRGGDE